MAEKKPMNALGHRSISSFLNRAITVVWYLEFLFLLTPALVFLEDNHLRYSWPLTLNTAETKPAITPVGDQIARFALHDRNELEQVTREQTLSFEDSTLGRKLLQTAHNLVYIALIMFVTWQLKQLFSGFSANQPFEPKNAARIKWIAFAVLSLAFFDILETFLHYYYTRSTILLSGARFDWYNDSFDGRTLLFGLLLLVLSEVFQRGAEHQADSESIL
ncbi:DUF2975 domain-containing protein [Dyadobacter crusticola]|uniref:DUF2975 domain-containing protein n=1 Tax=Dyadobacter crusticola TaxID=292407 RepID=UPI0012F8F6B4|nr:DUF2975 domain-containing protein [Dyadobacter crusticola]